MAPDEKLIRRIAVVTRIGLISDLHYRNVVPGTSKNLRRETRRAGELLQRCLEELTKRQVDALVCAGDCVDDESQPGRWKTWRAWGRCWWLPDCARSWCQGITIRRRRRSTRHRRWFYDPARQRVGECELLVFGEDVSAAGTEQALRSAPAMGEMAAGIERAGAGDAGKDVQELALSRKYTLVSTLDYGW